MVAMHATALQKLESLALVFPECAASGVVEFGCVLEALQPTCTLSSILMHALAVRCTVAPDKAERVVKAISSIQQLQHLQLCSNDPGCVSYIDGGAV